MGQQRGADGPQLLQLDGERRAGQRVLGPELQAGRGDLEALVKGDQ